MAAKLLHSLIWMAVLLVLHSCGAQISPWAYHGEFPELARLTACSCVYESTYYVFGGVDLADQTLGTFAALDLEGFKARSIPASSPWPAARYSCWLMCDVPRKTVYLFGGKKDREDMWAYSVVNGTWRELPGKLSGAPYSHDSERQGTDVVYANTKRYIIGAGSDDGAFPDYLTFDKETETWLPIKTDDRLMMEDPAVTVFGDGCCAAVIGGTRSTQGSIMPEQVLYLNTTEPLDKWEWRDMKHNGLVPSGEEMHAQNINDTHIILIGDPSGKGDMAPDNGMMAYDLERGFWTWVNRTQTFPLHVEFMTASYKGKLYIIGGGTNESLPGDVWSFDLTICPDKCNGRGRCFMGNCIECVGSSGIACEVLDPESQNLTPLVIGVSVGAGVFIVVLGAVLWHSTKKMRAYRRLYNTTRVAADMAEKVASMELEELDYLNDIAHPSATQRSFQTIVSTLKLYRTFLPASVREAARAKESDSESEEMTPTCSSVTSEKGIPGSSLGAHRPILANELRAKLQWKQVAHVTMQVSDFWGWMGELSQCSREEGASQACSALALLADVFHHTVTVNKGTPLEVNLGTGAMTAAWNFHQRRNSPIDAAMGCMLALQSTTAEKGLLDVTCSATGGLAYCGNLGGAQLRAPAIVGKMAYEGELALQVGVCHKVKCVTTTGVSETLSYVLKPLDGVNLDQYHFSVSGQPYVVQRQQGRIVPVYELVGDKACINEEWMYCIEEEQQTWDKSVFTAYLEGRTKEANDMLQNLMEQRKLHDEDQPYAERLLSVMSGEATRRGAVNFSSLYSVQP